jgi:hypothetical protein
MARGDSPILAASSSPWCLVSSRGALENKKIFKKIQGVPKAPTWEESLVSTPRDASSVLGAILSIDTQASIRSLVALAWGRPFGRI